MDAQKPAPTPKHFEGIEPTSLSWTPEGHMAIGFDDGVRAVFRPDELRAMCPCAECKGTHGGPPKAFTILNAKQVQGAALQTIVRGVEPVGRYGLCFTWGDGHKEGLYTWALLRAEAETRQG